MNFFKKNKKGKKKGNESTEEKLKTVLIAKITGIAAMGLAYIVGIAVIVAVILAPLAYSWILVQGTWGNLVESSYKVKTETLTKFLNYIEGGAAGKEYESYLINMFSRVNDVIGKKEGSDSLDEDEIEKSQHIAIGWVYARIYQKHFNNENMFSNNLGDDVHATSWNKLWANIGEIFGGDEHLKYGYYFKDEYTTASTLFDARTYEKDYIATVRRNTLGDKINTYDIQAFDGMSGQIYNLMRLNIQSIRDKYKDMTKDEIKDLVNKNLLGQYEDEGYDLLRNTFLIFEDALDTTKKSRPKKYLSLPSIIKKNSDKKLNLYGNAAEEMFVEEMFVDIIKENYDSSNPHMVTIVDRINKYEKDNKIKIRSLKTLAKVVIEEIVDFELIKTINTELPSMTVRALKKLDFSAQTKTDIEANIGNYIKTHKLGVFGESIESATKKSENRLNKLKEESEKKITNNTIEEFVENEIKAEIEKLKLTLTYEAALTYRNALSETKVTNSYTYYTYDFSPIVKSLEKLVVIGEAYENPLNYSSEAMLFTNDDYYELESPSYIEDSTLVGQPGEKHYLVNISDKLYPGNSATELMNTIFSSFYRDANKLPIIAGISKNDGSNIFAGQLSDAISSLKVSLLAATEGTIDKNLNALGVGLDKITNLDKVIVAIENNRAIVNEIEVHLNKILADANFHLNTELNFNLANITTVYKPGLTDSYTINKDTLVKGSTSSLNIEQYRYTQEEAVKITARKHYTQILKSLGGKNATGIPISIGDIEIGTMVDSENLTNAKRYVEYFEKYGTMYGVDPYLAMAMASQESRGMHDETIPGNASGYKGVAWGIMQVEDPGNIITEVSAYNFETGENDYFKVKGHKTSGADSNTLFAADVEHNIRIGIMNLANHMNSYNCNILLSLQAYNYGSGGIGAVIKLFGESTGQTKDEVINNVNDLGWMAFREEVHENPSKYFSWNEEKYPTYGDKIYIEHVLRYYDTSQGAPWVLDRDGNVFSLSGDGLVATVPGTSQYHKDNTLILWKEYYEDKNIFDRLNSWAEEIWSKQEYVSGGKWYSEILEDEISKYVANNTEKISLLGLSVQKFEPLLAGKIYIDTQFKVENADITKLKELIKTTGDGLLSAIEKTAGMDIISSIYLSSLPDKDAQDLFLIEIVEYSTFGEYVKSKYSNTATSTLDENPTIIKAMQIIYGDFNIDVKNMFDLLTKVNDIKENSVDTVQLYYDAWKSQKRMFTELYAILTGDKSDLEDLDDNYQQGATDFTPGVQVEHAKLNVSNDGDLNIGSVSWQVNYLFVNRLHKSLTPKYIIIHDTASYYKTVESARDDFFDSQQATLNPERKTSHFAVDGNKILQMLPLDEQAKHIDKSKEFDIGVVTNANSLSVSIVNSETDDAAFKNTIALVKHLMNTYSIPSSNVLLHRDVETSYYSDLLKNCSPSITEDKWNTVFIPTLNSAIKVDKVVIYSPGRGIRERIIDEARIHIGKPYVWGATGPDTFDCSGLTQYVYKKALNMDITRTTYTQMPYAEKAGGLIKINSLDDLDKAEIGDLIFTVHVNTTNKPEHVAIYSGKVGGIHQKIHAPAPGKTLIENPVYLESQYEYYIGKILTDDKIAQLEKEFGSNPSDVQFIRPTSGRVTSSFGRRVHPVSGKLGYHHGVDFGDPYNTPIKASATGKVIVTKYSNGYGNYAIIDHGNNYYTLYAHMQEYKCKVGDTLLQGQTVGLVGSTGQSTGAHLHFEILKGSSSTACLDEKHSQGIASPHSSKCYRLNPADFIEL